ncbi:hypothetical protein H6F67_01800 [Microcoleus sp. FACHB-1515]|uniref:hypothetical protein n=1 Tax=Cyanophyceae TaxID=3028117 RepID=UPI0016863481|nr:hypothetical protein [Microcoleus sp. FACHB-1515]MBD2088595.1 hypothetical protein [Microcoleus sp. FACHB-1515]
MVAAKQVSLLQLPLPNLLKHEYYALGEVRARTAISKIRRCKMHIQPIGLLGYQLYRLGWQNSLHQHLPKSQHWLLSIFLYYRRGFAEASLWIEEYKFERKL